MRKSLLTLAGLAVLAVPLPAQSADEIVVKYLTNVGGMDKIQAVTTASRRGSYRRASVRTRSGRSSCSKV